MVNMEAKKSENFSILIHGINIFSLNKKSKKTSNSINRGIKINKVTRIKI